MKIALAIMILAFLIIVHEIGHYIAARRIGIPVYECSVGFGKLLWSRTSKDGVQFSLRLIPLGGYVKMAGEEPGDNEDPNGYNHRTPLEKIITSFSGPFMNFVAAAVLFIAIFAVIGVANPVDKPVLGTVLSGKPAEQAGLKPGDRILNIDGTDVATWKELMVAISSHPVGSVLPMTVERSGEVFTVEPTTIKNDATGGSIIGVQAQVVFTRENLPNAVIKGCIQTYDMTIVFFQGFQMLFTGQVPVTEISGPVGITNMIGDAYDVGWDYLLLFAGFLSINLGIMNLLPIPALDGSRIVFALIELVRRKPIDPEKEGLVHMIGFIFLIGLMLLATFSDIAKLVRS